MYIIYAILMVIGSSLVIHVTWALLSGRLFAQGSSAPEPARQPATHEVVTGKRKGTANAFTFKDVTYLVTVNGKEKQLLNDVLELGR